MLAVVLLDFPAIFVNSVRPAGLQTRVPRTPLIVRMQAQREGMPVSVSVCAQRGIQRPCVGQLTRVPWQTLAPTEQLLAPITERQVV